MKYRTVGRVDAFLKFVCGEAVIGQFASATVGKIINCSKCGHQNFLNYYEKKKRFVPPVTLIVTAVPQSAVLSQSWKFIFGVIAQKFHNNFSAYCDSGWSERTLHFFTSPWLCIQILMGYFRPIMGISESTCSYWLLYIALLQVMYLMLSNVPLPKIASAGETVSQLELS